MKKTLLFLLAFMSVSSFAQLAMEGFEGNVWPPAGWAVVNSAGAEESWERSDPLSPIQDAYQGLYSAQLASEDMPAGTTSSDWLITPQFTIPPNGQISFYSRLSQPGNQGSTYKVLLTTDPGQMNIGTYIVLEEWTEVQINPAQQQYNQVTVALPQTMIGMQAYAAFLMEGDNGDGWLIDNVQMSTACPAPANLAVTNIALTSATLNWIETGTASQWEVEVVPQGAAPTGLGVISNVSPYIVTGLVNNACYQYYVRSICGGGNASAWVGPMQFCTPPCSPMDQCVYTFSLTDAFGDAWNGNSISVLQNGNVVTTLAMVGTGGESTVDVPLCEGIPMELFWNAGNFSNEVGLTVTNSFGQVVYEKPYGVGQPNSVIYSGSVQCVADFCYPPFNIQSEAFGGFAAAISWGGPSNNYEYYLVPNGSPAPTGETEGTAVTGTSFQLEDLLPNTSYDIYARSVCPELLGGFINSTWEGPSTFVTASPTVIVGTVVVDANEDSICGEGDYNIPNAEVIAIINNNNPFSTYTNEFGQFVIDSLSNGLNTVTLQLVVPEGFEPQPPVTEVIEVIPSTTYVDMHFCLAMPEEPILSLSASLVPISEAKPGFPAYYQLVVVNNSPVTMENTLTTITFNNARMEFVSADNPSTIDSGTITVTLPELVPFGSSVTSLMFSVMITPVNIGGEQLDFAVLSTMDADGEAVTATGTLQQIIVNSFDPNDITVHEGPFVVEEQADDFLTYTIRFQNTGTADAINVRLENELDELLDWGTFQPITASHSYLVTRDEGDLEFSFTNIHLPAEQDDEPASHGFVTYRIKPTAAFGIGDVVSNSAGIFFDFNEPIYTNTATTEVVALGTENFNFNNARLYPNPVNDQLNIIVAQGNITAVKVYDLNGREINVLKTGNVVNVSALIAGVYIVNITTTEGSSIHRIIKK